MSAFGGFGGGGGFGQGNAQPQTTGFGGFGAGANSNAGAFGANNNNAFGANNNNATPSLFGGGNPGGFGTGGSAFGTGANPGFGANKPGFGSAAAGAGGGLFGNNNSNPNNPNSNTAGGFGFGANANNANNAFGGGGMFASNKPSAFGSTTLGGGGTTGGGLFNTQNNGTAAGFGSAAAGGAFGGALNNPGIGANVGDPPGTAIAPFQCVEEKEGAGAAINHFQNVAFQDAYKKWSQEELRLADYAQGRRHGNASGAGAFGFGSGFGTNNTNATNNQAGGLFGGGNNNANAGGGGLFGNNNNAGGFGQAGAGFGNANNNQGGGLFGSKPAGNAFGAANNQGNAGAGIFGGGGGFGASNNTNNTTTGAFGAPNNAAGGGGLFGNANQNKPGGFGAFGSGTATAGFSAATPNNAFGGNNNAAQPNAGGGIFGAANNNQGTTGGLFGNTNNPITNAQGGFGAGFGAQNQQQQNAGGGLFGNNAQKPAGASIFGGNAGGGGGGSGGGGGLFGNANNANSTNTGFGSANNAANATLFGTKPAGTGGGLFGQVANNAQNTNTGGGLFGGMGANNQNQQQQGMSGTGMFGTMGQNQQKPSIFGNAGQAVNSGTGLFGNAGQPQNSLFSGAGNQQQQQQAPVLGMSLLGGSQNQNAATPPGITTSLTDLSAYGSTSLFANLNNSVASSPGPLATPLSKSTQKRSSVLAIYKLNPAHASRMATPQKRGFGLSYGTPGAANSGAVGRGSLLGPAGAALGLSKSMSSNNLRRTLSAEDSILAPGALSNSVMRYHAGIVGSSKRLNINKEIRTDLFSPSHKDGDDAGSGARKFGKRVSFDTPEGSDSSGPVALIAETAHDAHDTPSRPSGGGISSSSTTPDAAEHNGKGKEVAVVTGEGQETGSADADAPIVDGLVPVGPWVMDPSWEEISDMSREQRTRVPDFVISRANAATIEFKQPVDLSGLTKDEICGTIVQLIPRKASVYPAGVPKPPRGQGLNVPARLTIHQAWPRHHGKRGMDDTSVQEHIRKLQKVPRTSYESYDARTGTWIFSVQHFTTYGVDGSDATDDENDDDHDDDDVYEDDTTGVDFFDNSGLHTSDSGHRGHDDDGDDTFAFRKSRVPGSFHDAEAMDISGQPFLGSSPAGQASFHNRMRVLDDLPGDADDEYDMSEGEGAAGHSFGGRHHASAAAAAAAAATEHDDNLSLNGDRDGGKGAPGGILRARMRALKEAEGPMELRVADGNDWAEMLRKTVSPVKGDRQTLKRMQEAFDAESPSSSPSTSPSPTTSRFHPTHSTFTDRLHQATTPLKSQRRRNVGRAAVDPNEERGFSNSIDLMKSLFGDAKESTAQRGMKSSVISKGFAKWPYDRRDKSGGEDHDEIEKPYRAMMKPSWGPGGVLVFSTPHDFTIARLGGAAKPPGAHLANQIKLTTVSTIIHEYVIAGGERRRETIPAVRLDAPSLFDLFHAADTSDPASAHEKLVWELASILFDTPPQTEGRPAPAVRKARLGRFWKSLVQRAAAEAAVVADSSEEKAVACLGGHLVPEACKHLLEGRNFHLATLVPLLIAPGEQAKTDMREQLRGWKESWMLSEFSQPIRAIYELLAGNVCMCEGVSGGKTEHRVREFTISERFSLDWKRAFGLRLWYAISRDDDPAVAVKKFRADIMAQQERLPPPWYAEQGIEPLWRDGHADSRQDLLWGLLQLYAEPRVDLQSVLRPENSQLSPLDARLTWQLGVALTTAGKASFGPHAREKADAAALAFAAQLAGEGDWVNAVFVLLHLSDPVARMRAVQEQLARNADVLGAESDETFRRLADELKIPAAWIWEARALHMRSVRGDHAGEVQCLLRAGAFAEAHRVLVDTVAPAAIVEQDYEVLSELIQQFHAEGQAAVHDWGVGGELYETYLRFVGHRARGQAIPAAVLAKLVAGLPAMHARLEAAAGSAARRDYVKQAAVTCMADEVAQAVLAQSRNFIGNDLHMKIQSLPLTSDRRLRYSMDQSWDCFAAQVAG